MDEAALLERLAADGPVLIAAAEQAGWDAPVPATDWTVRELVRHVGGIHRWAADIVATASATPDTAAGHAVGNGPPDEELVDWFVAGHAALIDTLRNASDDLDCLAFLPNARSPRHFWCRRQAHETAMHRADAEGAAGLPTSFDCAFAHDGIDELLRGFAARPPRRVPEPGVIALDVTDGRSWRIALGERIVAEPAEPDGADCTVAGDASALYRWLWNRPAPVTVTGDERVAARWGATMRVRWS